jgi:hypothetical protein
MTGRKAPTVTSYTTNCDLTNRLCGQSFAQVASDRQGHRYAFNRPTGMRSLSPGSLRHFLLPCLSLACC